MLRYDDRLASLLNHGKAGRGRQSRRGVWLPDLGVRDGLEQCGEQWSRVASSSPPGQAVVLLMMAKWHDDSRGGLYGNVPPSPSPTGERCWGVAEGRNGRDVPRTVRLAHHWSNGLNFDLIVVGNFVPRHVIVGFYTKQPLLPQCLHNQVDLRLLLAGSQGVKIRAPQLVVGGRHPGNGQFYDPTRPANGTRGSERVNGERLDDGDGFD